MKKSIYKIRNSKFETQNSKGFSLIELLFVIGLIMFLTAASMPITLGFFNDQVLDEAAIALKNNIKSARAKAISGRGSGFWGIRIEEDKYIIFNGKNFESRDSARDIPVNLPSGMTFERPNREIVFEKDIGKPFYDPSLVGHWEMDAGEGCTAYDYSGLGNHGLLNPDCSTNSPSWTEDKDGNPGRALDFDGSDDYIEIADDESLHSSEGAIAFWLKTNNAVEYQEYIHGWNGNLDNRIRIYSVNPSVDSIHLLLGVEGAIEIMINGDSGIESNKWYYFTIVQDGNGAVLYRNGVDITTEDSNSDHWLSDLPTLNQWQIGNNARTSGDAFNGTINNVSFYDRALSQQEIQNLYEGQGSLQLNFHNNSVGLEIDNQGNIIIN